MKIKTSELIGSALDWAVAKVEGHYLFLEVDGKWRCEIGKDGAHDIGGSGIYGYSPSTDWSHGGPLLAKYRIGFGLHLDSYLACTGTDDDAGSASGETHLIAACRAIVAAKIGDDVEIPQELTP